MENELVPDDELESVRAGNVAPALAHASAGRGDVLAEADDDGDEDAGSIQQGSSSSALLSDWLRHVSHELSVQMTAMSSNVSHKVQRMLSTNGKPAETATATIAHRSRRGRSRSRSPALSRSRSAAHAIWLLGSRYPLLDMDADSDIRQNLAEDFRSRIWLTYRTNFPVLGDVWTSDVGWGCMVRCGQCMLAETLVRHGLGREWRLCGHTEMPREEWHVYTRILWWFLDDTDTREHWFSIHAMARLGLKWNVKIGQWFAPTTIAQVLQTLVQTCCAQGEFCRFIRSGMGLRCHLACDGTLYRNEITEVMRRETAESDGDSSWQDSLFILIPIRLGIDEVNPIYYASLHEYLQLPQSVGIAGGKPNSALYFLGSVPETDELLYLDPHTAKPCVDRPSTASEISTKDALTYHCSDMRAIHMKQVDPSLLIGFYCRTFQDFQQLCSRLQEISNSSSAPIVTIAEQAPPAFDEEEDFGVLSEQE